MSASFLSAMNTRANHFAIDEENKQKAMKWDKLKQAIKDSVDDPDFDIWDFLGDELGLECNGKEDDERCHDSEDDED